MRIVIKNPSSPGASFTDRTNDSICKCFEWVQEHLHDTMTYKQLRTIAANEKGFSDDYARNFLPLMKKCGMVSYKTNGEMMVGSLFTNTGEAYVRTLVIERILKDEDVDEKEKDKTYASLSKVRQKLIFQGLIKLLNDKDCSYTQEMKAFLEYVKKYDRINREEFAYCIYALQNPEVNIDEKVIADYREGDISIQVDIDVHNDRETRERSGAKRRKTNIGAFTAYTYYSSLFKQAGLITEKEGYYYICNDYNERINIILDGGN